MTEKEMKELIDARLLEINENMGLCGEDAEEVLLNWFTEEFLIGEISREELNDFVSLMGYEISLDVCGKEVEEACEIMN